MYKNILKYTNIFWVIPLALVFILGLSISNNVFAAEPIINFLDPSEIFVGETNNIYIYGNNFEPTDMVSAVF